MSKMTFSVAGDMLIKRLFPMDYSGCSRLREQIGKADARFFNLETCLHNGGFWGNQFCGGSYLFADPKVLDIAKEFGFNMTSFANNHTFDFGHPGLEATLRNVRDSGLVNAGVGMNMSEAAAPAYLNTSKGRVALIAMTASIENQSVMAGYQSRRFPGRPGVNGLRVQEHLEVTPEQFAVIREIAETSGINVKESISRAEGYTTTVRPDGSEHLKDMVFMPGGRTRYRTEPNEEDMRRLERAIYEAQAQADYILVSIHAHELGGVSKETPAEFLEVFARRCIDLGAHAVIGHGPHLLRPLEIYKKRPIFYSLGDFVLHNESMDCAPEEMYTKYGMTSDGAIRDLFYSRSSGYTHGLLSERKMLESVVPYFEMDNGELTCLELMPVELHFDDTRWNRGNPRFYAGSDIIRRYAEMSEPYGTRIRVREDGVGIVELN